MKRLLLPSLAVSALLAAGTVRASAPTCTPGPNWTSEWTDAFGQTTYAISAPPCVYVGVPFDIVLTVTDTNFNVGTATVGMEWSVSDNTVLIPGASGDTIDLWDGFWTTTISVTYTEMIVNHDLVFRFTDFEDRISQGMHWTLASATVAGVTLDPYPPGAAPATTEPVDPATGCSTGGGMAGLLAFLALAVGLGLRRRA